MAKNYKKTRKMRTKTRKTRRNHKARKTARFVGGSQEAKFTSPLFVNQVRY